MAAGRTLNSQVRTPALRHLLEIFGGGELVEGAAWGFSGSFSSAGRASFVVLGEGKCFFKELGGDQKGASFCLL